MQKDLNFSFPVTEVITSIVGFVYYCQFLTSEYVQKGKSGIFVEKEVVALKKSKPGVIITIAREHGSSGKRWGDEKNYDLVVDSSSGVDETALTILKYIIYCYLLLKRI